MCFALLLSGLGVGRVQACECRTSGSPCDSLNSSSVVFLGTVVDPGVSVMATAAEIRARLRQVLPAKDVHRLDDIDEWTLADMKKFYGRILPKAARRQLRLTRNEEEAGFVLAESFPGLRWQDHPVRFQVETTFVGEAMPRREVWTGQGFGDCGIVFEKGRRYLVYVYPESRTGRGETSICTRTRQVEAADEEVDQLRALLRGERRVPLFEGCHSQPSP